MTVPFTEIHKDDAPVVTAADGSTVRILSKTHMASSIHVVIEGTSNPIYHHSRDEVWYVISGEGEMWRRSAMREAHTIKLTPGMSFTIPKQTTFQYRSTGGGPLEAVCVTIPPWPQPDADEVVASAGIW